MYSFRLGPLLSGVVTFVTGTVVWMHVFCFCVVLGLRHCRRGEDESGPTACYSTWSSQRGGTALQRIYWYHHIACDLTPMILNTIGPTTVNTTIEDSTLRGF